MDNQFNNIFSLNNTVSKINTKASYGINSKCDNYGDDDDDDDEIPLDMDEYEESGLLDAEDKVSIFFRNLNLQNY